jgi:hypothetical protein
MDKLKNFFFKKKLKLYATIHVPFVNDCCEINSVDMEPHELVVFALVSTTIALLVPLLWKSTVSLAFCFFCERIEVADQSSVCMIDEELVRQGYCLGGITYTCTRKRPSDGKHWLKLHTSACWILCERVSVLNKHGVNANSRYSIAFLKSCCGGRRGTERIRREIETSLFEFNKENMVTRFERLSPYHSSSFPEEMRTLGQAHRGQEEIVKQIVTHYQTHGNASALIVGQPGSGKSSVAYFVHKQLHSQGIQSSLILGWSPLMAGNHFDMHIEHFAGPRAPVIYLINEIDLACAMARSVPAAGSGGHGSRDAVACYAQNLTYLHDWLDRVDQLLHIIVIFTSKIPLEDFERDYAEDIRPGRVNQKFTLRK